MFDAIAPRYDLLNHLLSAGIDRRWRTRAIRTLQLTGRETLVDVATGTADVALAAAGAARVVGVDFAGAMLALGVRKVQRGGHERRITLVRGDARGVAAYPEDAKRGLAIFVGKGRCNFCHLGPAFTNGEFHDTGIPFFIGKGRVDPGRHAGIQKLRASPYNLLGRYNDDPARATATGTRHVRLEHRNFGEFRTPSLRNLALTAPYMHNGRAFDVDQAILQHDGEARQVRLNYQALSAAEKQALAAFLESL